MAETVVTVSKSWQGKLSIKEYRNWLAVGHALSIVIEGIRPFLEREMRTFQRYVAAKVGPSQLCRCTHTARRRPTPWHDLSNCAWASELQNYHNKRSPTWQQSDGTKWTDPNLGYWEIAKLFMPNLGSQAKDVVDAGTTDVTGLINLVDWCSIFKIQRPVVGRVRDTRNAKWGHAPQQELSELDRNEAFQAIRDLLEDPELVNDPDAQNALAEITALENSDLVNFEEIEMKVLKDLITSLREDVIAKVDQLQSQTSLDAAQTKKELQEVKDLINYYVTLMENKEHGMKEGESADGDDMATKEILQLLEARTRCLEGSPRSTSSEESFSAFQLKSIVLLIPWIFLSIAATARKGVSRKTLVLWITGICLLQSLHVMDDSSLDHGESINIC